MNTQLKCTELICICTPTQPTHTFAHSSHVDSHIRLHSGIIACPCTSAHSEMYLHIIHVTHISSDPHAATLRDMNSYAHTRPYMRAQPDTNTRSRTSLACALFCTAHLPVLSVLQPLHLSHYTLVHIHTKPSLPLYSKNLTFSQDYPWRLLNHP